MSLLHDEQIFARYKKYYVQPEYSLYRNCRSAHLKAAFSSNEP